MVMVVMSVYVDESNRMHFSSAFNILLLDTKRGESTLPLKQPPLFFFFFAVVAVAHVTTAALSRPVLPYTNKKKKPLATPRGFQLPAVLNRKSNLAAFFFLNSAHTLLSKHANIEKSDATPTRSSDQAIYG